MATEILRKLCNKAKLERDRGFEELKIYLNNSHDEQTLDAIENDLLTSINSSEEWEIRHGGMKGAICVLQQTKSQRDFEEHSKGFALALVDKALDLLDDNEFRVRIVAGELLGILCSILGESVYEDGKDRILTGIRTNLERHGLSEDLDTSNDNGSSDPPASILGMSPNTQSSWIERRSSNSSQIFHDTAGWKSLETYMKCLQSVVLGYGYGFNPFIDQELLDLIFETLSHTNRFVRETGYYVCGALVTCGAKDGSENDSEAKLEENNAIFRYGQMFSTYLAKGLADNWSQVRMAGSVATRQFLTSLPSQQAKEKFFPALLPPMCLNRYYMAEGVRIYSQETWRLITQGEGKALVEKYIDNVVEFYLSSTQSDNHAVREAACACIAELGSKIDSNAVRPHVQSLLETLLECFKDDSWPVRDAACIASGQFVLCFPDQSKSVLPSLYPLFFGNLEDNIASVRQGAACAICNVVKAYGGSENETVLTTMKEGFDNIKNQPATSEKYSNLERGPATFGVAKQLRDNDPDIHTDKQMYSCGSLAPKMGRGGGCMDHQFKKPSEPWEMADGCIHLVAELSQIASLHSQLGKLMSSMAKACEMKGYAQYPHFLETLCKQLPNMAKGFGKRPFKMYLELFFDHVFHALESEVILTSAAASQCLLELSLFLGPGIMRGRIEQYNSMFLHQFDAINGIPPP